MLILRVLCGILLLLCSSVFAKTSVFEISNGEHKLFVVGSVHLLPSSAYPLPSAFDSAYAQSSIMVFEADVRQLETAQGVEWLMRHARYQDDSTLTTILSPTTYSALEQQAAVLGLDINILDNFKPDFILTNLMQLALKKAELSGDGVDKYYLNKALQDQRELVFLETIEYQLELLFNLSAGDEDQFVMLYLNQLQDIATQLQNTIQAWRSGNLVLLADLAMEYANTAVGKQFYQRLLVQRNLNWLPQLEAMLATTEVEMVIVGALHLAAEGNLLQLLQQQGYQVKQL